MATTEEPVVLPFTKMALGLRPVKSFPFQRLMAGPIVAFMGSVPADIYLLEGHHLP